VVLRGADIGLRYAAEIDTYDDLCDASLYLSAQPTFNTQVSRPLVSA
jgi:hypothetical protein